MNLYVMLNYEMIEIPCDKYYLPFVLLDVREYGLKCEEVNSIMILMRNPRTNIDLISGVFQFYFENNPGASSLGQVQSNICFIYNMDKPKDKQSYPFVLFTEGFQIIEILIYMPCYKKQNFLKEIVYKQYPQNVGECIICFEHTSLVNLHKNQHKHEVCWTCLFKIYQCPLCRSDL